MAQYPWDEIKAKYETGQYSIAELSREYGFSERYGQRKAKENGWERGKSSQEVRDKATQKVIEDEADKEAELRREYEKIVNNIRRATANELFQRDDDGSLYTDFERLKQLKIGSQIIHNCRREQWEINEILEVSEKTEIKQSDKLDDFITAVNNLDVKK